MKLKKILRTLSLSAITLLAAQPANAQDMLARQAPVDRKMKAIDTTIVRQLTLQEELESPAADLYDNWDNKYAHRATLLPERYTINLQHFCMPTTSRVVTSNFGYRWGRQHKGLDIKVYIGDSIRAAFSGKVRIVRYEAAGYGKYIVIRHNNGLETIYGHLSKQLVKENQEVRAGDVIGLGGNTGRSTGSHLHFETRLCGVALNPALFFDFRKQDVTGDYYAFNRKTYDRESAEATRLRGKVGNGSYTREEVQGTASRTAPKAATVASNRREMKTYQAKSGDTLYSISRRLGTTVDELCRINHFNKDMRIRAGQFIKYEAK